MEQHLQACQEMSQQRQLHSKVSLAFPAEVFQHPLLYQGFRGVVRRPHLQRFQDSQGVADHLLLRRFQDSLACQVP